MKKALLIIVAALIPMLSNAQHVPLTVLTGLITANDMQIIETLKPFNYRYIGNKKDSTANKLTITWRWAYGYNDATKKAQHWIYKRINYTLAGELIQTAYQSPSISYEFIDEALITSLTKELAALGFKFVEDYADYDVYWTEYANDIHTLEIEESEYGFYVTVWEKGAK